MKLEYIFIGKPIEAEFNGKTIKTGIYKNKIEGVVKVSKTNIEGDQQADMTVHGGVDKAIYAYPIEHYEFWKRQRRDLHFAPGIFGENLSVSGLDEQVCVGDTFRIGAVILSVTSPRMPCYKLGIKMNDPGFVQDFMKAEKNGFYLKVVEEGAIESGNAIEKLSEDGHFLSIAEVIQLYTAQKQNKTLLQKAVDSPSLPADWRGFFAVRLAKL